MPTTTRILDETTCKVANIQRQSRYFYFILVLITITNTILVVQSFNTGIYDTLYNLGIIEGNLVPDNAWIGGVVEPAVSKLLPVLILLLLGVALTTFIYAFMIGIFAMLLFVDPFSLTTFQNAMVATIPGAIAAYAMYSSNDHHFICVPVLEHRWKAGILVGLTFGLIEAWAKVISVDGYLWEFFWNYPSYTSVILLPMLYHILEGMLIVGTFLTVIRSNYSRSSKILAVVGIVALMMTIHVWWNTWLIFYDPLFEWWKGLTTDDRVGISIILPLALWVVAEVFNR